MPSTSINFLDRRVIMSVLVLIGAVWVVNWRVLGPLREKRSRRSAAAEDELVIPADLSEMKEFARRQLENDRSGRGRNRGGRGVPAFNAADPFAVVPAGEDSRTETAWSDREGLVCTMNVCQCCWRKVNTCITCSQVCFRSTKSLEECLEAMCLTHTSSSG